MLSLGGGKDKKELDENTWVTKSVTTTNSRVLLLCFTINRKLFHGRKQVAKDALWWSPVCTTRAEMHSSLRPESVIWSRASLFCFSEDVRLYALVTESLRLTLDMWVSVLALPGLCCRAFTHVQLVHRAAAVLLTCTVMPSGFTSVFLAVVSASTDKSITFTHNHIR